MKLLRRADCILAGHRVGDEHHFARLGQLFDGLDLGHHLLVNRQPPGGVEHDDVVIVLPGQAQRVLADLDRRDLRALAVHGNTQLPAKRFKLRHRRRPVGIGRDEQRPVTHAAQPECKLGRHRRLA